MLVLTSMCQANVTVDDTIASIRNGRAIYPQMLTGGYDWRRQTSWRHA